jgi:hypothetical protein
MCIGMLLIILISSNRSTRAYEVYHSPATVKRRGNMFRDEVDTDHQALAAAYRRTFGISKTVNIHFVGVW